MKHVLAIAASRPRFAAKTRAHVVIFEPDAPVPTLYWSPTYSVFCDGRSNVREVWGLTKRNDAVALCRMTNVRFDDQSSHPILSS